MLNGAPPSASVRKLAPPTAGGPDCGVDILRSYRDSGVCWQTTTPVNILLFRGGHHKRDRDGRGGGSYQEVLTTKNERGKIILEEVICQRSTCTSEVTLVSFLLLIQSIDLLMVIRPLRIYKSVEGKFGRWNFTCIDCKCRSDVIQ